MVLVILGIVLIGIFTATLTTVMVGDEDDMEQLKTEMEEQFGQVMWRIEQIEQHIHPTDGGPQTSRADMSP